ncbi:uncharacterized protein FA14DRAFT_181597 [Meira miltonrushii]|uniref:Uncharacterized protein n=1 Tax=Meira miltonrushii TaxID=1280837 RepID=A0A316V603_9BASI|nr:uncharacterized protein FA14DRAFT_181597 [Meira miltonrushii]PWN32926.1 hypothetical protein FA14DRAFT_181597 [Meira miltonrushii]
MSNGTGSPNWDELLADGAITKVSSPESGTEPATAENPVQPSSVVDPVGDTGIPDLRTYTKKRTLKQDQPHEARRKSGNAWKNASPLSHEQAMQMESQEKRRRVKTSKTKPVGTVKTKKFKSRRDYYHARLKVLKEPGNESKLQEYKDRISKDNKTYMAKLKKEVVDGRASEQRKELYEKLDTPAQQRIEPEGIPATAQVPQWAAKKQASQTPKAIKQRERLAKLKSENPQEYLAFRERENQRIRHLRTSYTEEEKEKDRLQLKNSQRRFAERQKIAFKDPKNADSLKKLRKASSKASIEYYRRLTHDVRTGRASEKRIKIYENQKKGKKESARRHYERQKAADQAAKVTVAASPKSGN